MIKIVVDSASDIDLKEAEQFGITLMPMQIMFGEDEYLDGVNLSHKEFFEKLIESDELPKTSQINSFRFEEKFEELTQNGDEVIAIVISSKLSGTYNCAKTAAKSFNGKVHVVDSLNACIGERILCEYAIQLVNEGKLSAVQIVEELNNKKRKIQLLAVLDTLKYLKKGGRISSVVAFTGTLLSIKPVISITNGEVKMAGKARGSKNGNNLLIHMVQKCGGIDFSLPFAVGYSGLSEDYLNKYLNDSAALWKDNVDQVPSYMIGSTIGTHVGPGAIAVAFFAK
ncbi:MAG TPA: DegV family protein [Candidatus Pelethenecus sp.]|jgi:EDD domain protein, DegV family|nr:DegV family protein [Candidatus Pelethenecus sp.]